MAKARAEGSFQGLGGHRFSKTILCLITVAISETATGKMAPEHKASCLGIPTIGA